jgi:butyryl-CoA dehydrogenase
MEWREVIVDTGSASSGHTKELAALARSLAKERYAPNAARWDANREPFPLEERKYLGSLGLLGICLPERFGGGGAPLTDALVVIEELAKECRPAAFQVFEANTGPARVLALLGSDELQARILPRVITGETTMAVAISEPDAGSAATDMTTRAKLANGAYTINGAKRWISNGSEADHYFVYARLSR